MTFRLTVRLVAVAMSLLPLTSCHALLLFPCMAMSCGTSVTSIPPHNDPFARALAGGRDLETITSLLATVSQTQYDALDRRWPTEPLCARIAAVGCRYTIAVKATRHEGFRSDPAGCALLDVAVVDGPAGRVDVRQLGYRAMQCPQTPVTPDGASTPVAP